MKRLFLLITLCSSFALLGATQLQHQYDSVMNIMKDKSVPLLNRYYMTAEIGIFPIPQQVEILKTLVPEAKIYEDKAVITRLYSVIADCLILLEDMEGVQNYLDSAFVYKDQFNNNAILGMMYYVRGHYYHDINEVNLAHENYYDSVKFLQKLPSPPPLLTTIYYNLARIYVMWEDENRLKEIIDEMKEVPSYMTEQHLMNYTVIADLFSVQYNKSNHISLLDSVIKYNQLAIDQYNINANKETADVGHQLSQNFIALVRAYVEKGDVKGARKNLELAEKFVNKERWLTVVDLNVVKGDFFIAIKEYDKAEQVLNEAVELLATLKDEQQMDYYYYYIDIYEKLGLIYEKKKMYEKALTYEKQSLEYRQRLFSRESSKIVNDLRTQYNLEQQERIVNQLTLLSERRKNINILAIVVLILLFTLIVQLIIRSRITKRANENKLKLEQMKRKESELEIELYKTRQEEKEREFKIMQNEMQQRRIQSYLEGLETARERLSKELHDNISNELLALKMRVIQSDKPEEIIEKLGQIQAEVRAVSHDLMPPVFQHAQFTEVLFEYVDQWNKLTETHLTLTFDPEDESWDELTEDINLGLYRIIQETVGNSLKHSGATLINILLTQKEDNIILTIQDNGKGFKVEADHRGIGLKLISERAKGLDGEAFISSSPGQGTTIEVVIRNFRKL